MPDPDRRRPHAAFRRTLSRIAARLATKPVVEMRWNERLLFKRPLEARVRVTSLWVAGSFARGAPLCGDLDLIAEVTVEEGLRPEEPRIARALIGRVPNVSLYVGTPAKNYSGIAFPEARLIWSEDQPKWEHALDQIQEDSSATRFERKIDRLPFRADQLAPMEKARLEGLVDLRDAGALSWEFAQAESIDVGPDRWPLEAKACVEHRTRFMGHKTAEAFRLAVGFAVANRECWVDWEDVNQDGTTCQMGPYEFRTGRPSIDISGLDEPQVHALLIVPHHTRRGPNGVWKIARGPDHAVTRLFSDVGAWHHCREERPDLIHWSTGRWLTACVLQLFAFQDDAEEAKQPFDDDDQLQVCHSMGDRLLRTIAGADVVEVDGHAMPLTREGVLWVKEGQEDRDEREIVTAASLVARIRGDGSPLVAPSDS